MKMKTSINQVQFTIARIAAGIHPAPVPFASYGNININENRITR